MNSMLFLLLLGCAVTAFGTALDDYVNKPDENYAFYDTGQRLNDTDWTGYVLNMTSQRWFVPN